MLADKNFARLSDLLAKHNLSSVLIGFGKNDEHKAAEIMQNSNAKNIVNLVGKTSLMQTAALLKNPKLSSAATQEISI